MKAIDSYTDEIGIVKYNLKIDADDYEDDLKNLALNLRPTWSKECLKLKVFSGGLTNKLIGCLNTEINDQSQIILCRIFGSGSENYIT